MHPVELARLLQNLIRLGNVAKVDHAAVRVRVQCGALLTDWVPWLEARAGATRSWNPPTVGEQVVLLSPGGELRGAVVLCAVNSNACPAPTNTPTLTHWRMPDGAVLEYDHDAHHLRADLPGSASITAPKGMIVTGPVTIEGTLHVTKAITTPADVTAAGISLVNHKTTGVKSGSDKSGPPA
ncbi:phage baseplate assembly protein V [Larsenimonas suaedae]|uniref:Phage baseplate assembly protein V n=1 Tax=Larsenimonas suaedae TaxID=1851019 RepID=A0ABU1GYS3_9GAMM|nr:phage baseplate assembly protein V [Larsenimonas suaedae]MCM2973501.1 phage baseplate assembly protein V [Larsenimonas suaedae]MDR5897129.1 phage baseplate assembly protein V [Larsenimonas suaedae]